MMQSLESHEQVAHAPTAERNPELTSLASYGSRKLPGWTHGAAGGDCGAGCFPSSAMLTGSEEEGSAIPLSPRSSAYLRGLEQTLARDEESLSHSLSHSSLSPGSRHLAISPIVSLPPRRGLSIGYDHVDGSPLAPLLGSAGYYAKQQPMMRKDDLRPSHAHATALLPDGMGDMVHDDAVQRALRGHAETQRGEIGVPLSQQVVRSQRRGHAMASFATRAMQTRAASAQRAKAAAQRERFSSSDGCVETTHEDEGNTAHGARDTECTTQPCTAAPPHASAPAHASAPPPHTTLAPPPSPPPPPHELSGPAWSSYGGSTRPRTAGSTPRSYVVATRRAGARVGMHTGAHTAWETAAAHADSASGRDEPSLALSEDAAPVMDGLIKSPPFRAHAGRIRERSSHRRAATRGAITRRTVAHSSSSKLSAYAMQLDASRRRRLELQQQESGSLQGERRAGGGSSTTSSASASALLTSASASAASTPALAAGARANDLLASASTPHLHSPDSWPSEWWGSSANAASALATSASAAEFWADGGSASGIHAHADRSSCDALPGGGVIGGVIVGERVSTGEGLLASTASEVQASIITSAVASATATDAQVATALLLASPSLKLESRLDLQARCDPAVVNRSGSTGEMLMKRNGGQRANTAVYYGGQRVTLMSSTSCHYSGGGVGGGGGGGGDGGGGGSSGEVSGGSGGAGGVDGQVSMTSRAADVAHLLSSRPARPSTAPGGGSAAAAAAAAARASSRAQPDAASRYALAGQANSQRLILRPESAASRRFTPNTFRRFQMPRGWRDDALTLTRMAPGRSERSLAVLVPRPFTAGPAVRMVRP